MALECNLSADKMIKKIFFFIYTGDPFLGCWKTDSEPIRKKFEMNGYVMPNIVCWDLEFRLIPIVISTGDMKNLFGFNYWSWLVCVYTVYSYSSTAPDWCLLFLWNTVTLEIITLPHMCGSGTLMQAPRAYKVWVGGILRRCETRSLS